MLALLLLAATASPPEIQWTAIPTGGIVDVECAGYINEDSTEDVFAASSEASGYGVMCLDGASGGIIWITDSIPGIAGMGCLRSIRDVDGDGCRDVAAGLSTSPSVAVLSGSTGDVLWTVSQAEPVCWIETAIGPGPFDTNVLANTRDSYWTSCSALSGQSGMQEWETPYVATSVDYIKVTESDFNGTGWSELVLTVNRQAVSSGWEDVLDGADGSLIHREYTMYYGAVDVCDTPLPLMVISNMGTYPVMWAWSFVSWSVVWTSDDYELSFGKLEILPDITGPPSPEREVLGVNGSHMTLVSMDEDYLGWYGEYTFPATVKALDSYCDAGTWKIAVVTTTSFHCPELEFSSPSIEPSIILPNTDASDLCMLSTNLFPTPLVAVAMQAPGPGVCSICTSWFEGIEDQPEPAVPISGECSPNPCDGMTGIYWVSGSPGTTSIEIFDSSGRLRSEEQLGIVPQGQHSSQLDLQGLPSGCYLVVVTCGSERASTKLVLLM